MSADAERSLSGEDLKPLTAEIAAAYLSNHEVPVSEIADVIRRVHDSLTGLGVTAAAPAAPAERPKPAVPISRSVQHDHLVCLEDGKRMKMLKRYLRARFNMTPEEYRRRWGLPADYPMVAPAYAERRSQFAKDLGLGKGVRRRT
jgi:predicted transcriptional regulator